VAALVATAKDACYQARGFGQGSATALTVHALFQSALKPLSRDGG
jgi:hypothetical protein